jgi:para-aminobenzoate synthetase component 2
MILMIDNYDSFTYNLVQYLGELGQELHIHRNDKITVEEVTKLAPKRIVISPGPGRPGDAGLSKELIRTFYKDIPILGVCLGHQAIGEVFGAKTIHAPYLMHGKTSLISHDNKGVFKDLPNPMQATRYHSLIVDEATLPEELEISARTNDDNILMGFRHKEYPCEGVQFHPESILTPQGKQLLKNFIS